MTTRAAMVWGTLTARGDLEAFFKKIADNGGNCLRMFINFLEDDCLAPSPLPPFKIVGWWNPGQLAGEPAYDHDVPMFDVAQINPDFTIRLRAIASMFAKYKVSAWIVFDDRCSEMPDTWMAYNDPWYSNTIAYPHWADGDWHRAVGGGNKARELDPYREALERHVLAIFRDAGCATIYGEPLNEFGYEPGPAYTLDMMLDWYAARSAALKSMGYSLVMGSARDPITELIAPYVNVYDLHGIKRPEDIEHGLLNEDVIIDTDGADGEGAVGAWGYHSLDATQADILGAAVADGYYAGFCMIFQEASDDKEKTQNLDAITSWGAFKTFSLASGWTPPEPPVEYVSVAICTSSNKVANQYCPTAVAVEFIKGQEPTEVCTIHTAPPTPPDPDEDTIMDKIKDILHWLFGENSWWQRYPHLTGFLLGFAAGALAVAVL
jgi:hypothetical protein